VYLDCQFVIATLVFSNVYIIHDKHDVLFSSHLTLMVYYIITLAQHESLTVFRGVLLLCFPWLYFVLLLLFKHDFPFQRICKDWHCEKYLHDRIIPLRRDTLFLVTI
jgi:hypothetical protein